MINRNEILKPQSWRKVAFGDVVRNVDETIRDPQNSGLERYVGLEHIDPESLHIQRWGLISEGTSFTRRFRKGQVLFGKRRAYQRKVAVAEFDGLCSSDILVFEPKDDRLLPELLPFICQSDGFFEHALDTSAGSLSPRTKFKELARYEFPLPPLDEQCRIAEILWAADRAINNFEKLSVHIENYYLQYLATKLAIPSPDGRKVKIKEVAEINCQTYSEKTTPSDFVIEYIDISCLESKTIGPTVKYEFGEAPSRARRKVTNGDILLSMVRPYFKAFAKVNADKENLVASTGICVVSPGPEIDADFLLHIFFTKDFFDYCNERMTGTNYPAIKPSDIAEYSINLPSLGEQIEMASLLSLLDKNKKEVDIHVQKIKELSKFLINEHLAYHRSI